ncbi:FAD-binding oxidoreductase [Pseudomaricurvus hydrocarbonicus]
MSQIEPETVTRLSLTQNLEVDIAIIGAGYSGLWTAYYLKQQAPNLKIAILEANQVGFGASGRNGGWLMGSVEGEHHLLRSLSPSDKPRAHACIHGIVDEAKRVFDKEQIDCDFAHGGWLSVAARYPEQLPIVRNQLQQLHAEGHSEHDYCWLDHSDMQSRVNIHNTYGGIFSPHAARIHPAKLVNGLAKAVERLGVSIYEHTTVTKLLPPNGKSGQLVTPKGVVQADIILPCVEGFSYELEHLRRYILPIQSLIVATEPLSDSQWQDIGMRNHELVNDACRLVTYAQRTADNRLVFGSRGTYQFGGKPKSTFQDNQQVFATIATLMKEFFPMLGNTPVTHCWGGTLGMPRVKQPHALFDTRTGIGSIGGYAGEGVGASNLMARTLADLILNKDTELTQMPWAHHNTLEKTLRRWEPEPFRWLAYKSILSTFSREESILSDPDSAPWKRKMIHRAAGLASRVL